MEHKRHILNQFKQRLEIKYGQIPPSKITDVFDKLLLKEKVTHQVRFFIFIPIIFGRYLDTF
jgi:hypothetical protein